MMLQESVQITICPKICAHNICVNDKIFMLLNIYDETYGHGNLKLSFKERHCFNEPYHQNPVIGRIWPSAGGNHF